MYRGGGVEYILNNLESQIAHQQQKKRERAGRVLLRDVDSSLIGLFKTHH